MGVGASIASASTRAVLGVIFSKDRPLQLDATLRSLELNCSDLDRAQIHVLWTASSPLFAAGYRVLAQDHPLISFHREVSFKADLVGLLSGVEHVLFVVDDTIFVGDISVEAAITTLEREPGCLGFSYRLGRNTTYCYTLDAPQHLPAFDERVPGHLTFDWTGAEHDFGYPLEVSSSLYRTSDILPLVRTLEYRNPNTLESALAQHAATFRETRPRLACYAQSVAFSVPANLVQTAWQNRVDTDPALTAEALADSYARGQRLDIERYSGFVANAAHQELEFVFRRNLEVPTVSVVVPCYNQARYLCEAIRSVATQTFTDWEVVVIDDGSSDDTARVAAALAAEIGRRVRVIRQANAGLPAARNAGISAARGRYILPLDADDLIEPTMLEETLSVLESDLTVSYVYTDAVHFNPETERVVPAEDYDARLLVEHNQPNYCALYRASLWDTVGGYNVKMNRGYEDWDFWLSSAEAGAVGKRLARPLLRYRVRPGSMYSQALQVDGELRQQIRRNHPKLYGLPARVNRLFGRVRRVKSRIARTFR